MSVTAAAGFRAAGIAAGIKAAGALDLALLAAARAVPAAAVFTTSLTAAAPVEVSRRRVAAGRARAVLLNSGCANAGTGTSGLDAAEATTAAVAAALACPPDEVLVCSTGPIGPVLPVGRMVGAVPALVASLGASRLDATAAAHAILTTDSHPKEAVSGGHGWSVGGMAKGAGMIRPDMATMLAVLTTDAVAAPDVLVAALRRAVAVTFNCLDIDGCQSTNDTVILLASGDSGVSPAPAELEEAVETVCRFLAEEMAADAEGASKVVHIEISGAASLDDARRLGLAVADSALVRASFFGADPNWGRVFGALGVAGVPLEPDRISVAYEGVEVCAGGAGVPFDDDALSARLGGDFAVSIRVGDGPGSVVVVTTDLTPDYVRFNGDRS